MTRTDPSPNPLAVGVIIAGTIATLDTILLIAHPELWPWMLAIYAACALLGVGLVAYEFWAQRDEARAEVERLERECDAHAAENARLAGTVAVPLRRLRSVPRPPAPTPLPSAAHPGTRNDRRPPIQTGGEHDRLALSREEWAAIERETEGPA